MAAALELAAVRTMCCLALDLFVINPPWFCGGRVSNDRATVRPLLSARRRVSDARTVAFAVVSRLTLNTGVYREHRKSITRSQPGFCGRLNADWLALTLDAAYSQGSAGCSS